MLVIRACKSEHVLIARYHAPTLQRADLSFWSLNHAWLCGFDLRGALLEQAQLRGANLSGANLCGANLEGANLDGAVLQHALYDERTRWPGGFDPEAAGARMCAGTEAWSPGPAQVEALRRGERVRSREAREQAEWRRQMAEQLQLRAVLVAQESRALQETTTELRTQRRP